MLLPPRPTPVDAFTNDEGLEASRKLIKHYVARMHCRTKKDHSLFSCPVPCKSGASGRSFEVAWNPDRRVGFGHPTCGGQIVYLRTSDSPTEKKLLHKKTAGATKIEGRWRCRFRRPSSRKGGMCLSRTYLSTTLPSRKYPRDRPRPSS
jgi:hypothetical protein